jgi:hypothetical protein
MKITIKLLCLCSLVLFAQAHFSEQLQMRGRQLSFLRNLPHRYLGMLYWSWNLQPHRSELLKEYAVSWHVAVRERGCLLEGQTKPTVPLLVAYESAKNPDLRLLSKLLLAEEVKDHLKRQQDK